MLCSASRRRGRFQLQGDSGGLPFLLAQHRLELFGFFPSSVDFGVRPIFDGLEMQRLGVTLGSHAAFMRLERFVQLHRTLLPSIALLQELSHFLAGLLLHETLDVRQSRLGDLTRLTRASRLISYRPLMVILEMTVSSDTPCWNSGYRLFRRERSRFEI